MPLNRLKVWRTGDEPTAGELNAEFDNIIGKFSANITAGDVADDILEVDSTLVNAAAYDTIQAAVNAAASTGKSVLIPPGTYDSDTATIEVPANVRLKGAGAGLVTLKPATNFNVPTYLRFTGTNSGIEGVTIESTNLHSENLIFNLVEIETSVEANVYITRCILKASPVVNLVLELLRIATSAISRDLVRITDTDFIGTSSAASSAVGIRVATSYRTIIDRCGFVDMTTYSIQMDNATQGWINACRFERSNEQYSNMVYTRGGVLIENCSFNSNCDFVSQLAGTYCTVRSFVNRVSVIRNCAFSYSGYTTYPPIYGLKIVGNIAAYGNQGAAGAAGFSQAFIRYESNSPGNDHTYLRENTANLGELYSVDSLPVEAQYYTKSYAGNLLFSIEDVFMWMDYSGTTNYLRFKQGSAPSSASDDHARIALTGTTNISD